jgi:hypothetical protein
MFTLRLNIARKPTRRDRSGALDWAPSGLSRRASARGGASMLVIIAARPAPRPRERGDAPRPVGRANQLARRATEDRSARPRKIHRKSSTKVAT